MEEKKKIVYRRKKLFIVPSNLLALLPLGIILEQ